MSILFREKICVFRLISHFATFSPLSCFVVVKYMYIFLAIIILLAFAQIMIARSTDSTEQQRYSVLMSDGNFEVRRYDAALMASVSNPASTIRSGANGSFRRLAGFIFGGNDRGQQIAMTAPVHMEQSDSGNSMSFVMPSSVRAEDLPKPDDEGIRFHTAPEQYVAAVRFSGFASDQDIDHYEELLRKWLELKGLKPISAFRYLGYNPPYQLVNRRNEVAVTISSEDIAFLNKVR